MPDKVLSCERYGEAFWRKHHEAWQQSALNQREYCEAHGILPFGIFDIAASTGLQITAVRRNIDRRNVEEDELIQNLAS